MIAITLSFLNLLLTVLSFAIIARALMSWLLIDPYHPAAQFLFQITEPIMAPLRRIVPAVGMMDITPIVAILLLQVLQSIVIQIQTTYFP